MSSLFFLFLSPWEEFSSNHEKNDRTTGVIKSITDFGIFIGLEGGIDGLVHLSDLAWDDVGEDAVRNYKKGDEIEAVVLAVDAERERISLGVKQLDQDPFSAYVVQNPRGTLVSGNVASIDGKVAYIELAENVEGMIKASELSTEPVDDIRQKLKEGDSLESLIVGIDRKKRVVNLSVKAKESEEEAAALEEYGTDSGGTATLGDLLKEQMDSRE